VRNARRTLTIVATKQSLKARIVRTYAAKKLPRSARSVRSVNKPDEKKEK